MQVRFVGNTASSLANSLMLIDIIEGVINDRIDTDEYYDIMVTVDDKYLPTIMQHTTSIDDTPSGKVYSIDW